MILKLAWKSLTERRASVLLTLISISISVFIASAVVHIRDQAQSSFDRTVSGVDLIVGPRTSQINLLLYSVFRIGYPGNGISWQTYELIKSDNRVNWVIPVSLGDSHQGFRVIGTNNDYFQHYQFGTRQTLDFSAGGPFQNEFDAVMGAEVARQLQYSLGDSITISHGVGATSFMHHDDAPFTIVGILAATGTPVDHAVHITLAGLDAAHGSDHHSGDEHERHDEHEHNHGHDHEHEEVLTQQAGANLSGNPEQITAMLMGLQSRSQIFSLQHAINEFPQEALTAIIPGVALSELWQLMGTAENILLIISVLVLLSSLTGLATMLMSSMRERQQEIYLYRAIGMRSSSILLLIQIEAVLVTVIGITSGMAALFLVLAASQQWLSQRYGLFIDINPLSTTSLSYACVILSAAILLAFIPATTAYRSSLGEKLKL